MVSLPKPKKVGLLLPKVIVQPVIQEEPLVLEKDSTNDIINNVPGSAPSSNKPMLNEIQSESAKLVEAAPQVSISNDVTLFHNFFGSKKGILVQAPGKYSRSISTLESYMVGDDDLVYTTFRLLDVDRRLVLPTLTHLRLLITSADVIHSWAVPSLGIKVDAVPGRLNQIACFIKRTGVFYGQCSELCGVNHGFMPVVVSALDRHF
jgi:heme/copper-type cytochrome/quinol oxidase subunit 2